MATIAEALTLAVQHHQAGRFPAAEQLYRNILAAAPDNVDGLHLLGILSIQIGRPEAAIEHLGQAIRIRPHQADLHNHLGEAWRALGRLAEAIACYHQALALAPTSAQAHNNLGNAYHDVGRYADAIASFQHALECQPNWADALLNLGHTLRHVGQLDEARACARRAVALKPEYAEAHLNLGHALRDEGKIPEAIACYRRAVELKPSDAALHSHLLFTLHFSADFDARALLDEHRLWNQAHAEPLARLVEPHTPEPSSHRRLRIGYVSADFTYHPIGRFLLPLLQAHDPAKIETYCYASVRLPDKLTDLCRLNAGVWRDVRGRSDEQLARIIREDKIDILVDLSAHAEDNRLLVFARKPAPVQVTYLAYCSTTGLDMMDYRLTDPYLDPQPSGPIGPMDPRRPIGRCYSEESIWLPETYWCYQPPVATPAVNVLPALGAGHVTFGCFNTFCKVTQPTLLTWSRLLQALPDARLLLSAKFGSHRERVRALLTEHGVAPERLSFVDPVLIGEYFKYYERIDVALDPFPFGGGTTTCDALWMGVPVVSLAGKTAVGRAALSILSNVGLPDLVARDPDDYINLAVNLASHRSRLSDLRAGLRARMQASPLMDVPRFARNLEAVYQVLWRHWCNKA